MWIEPHRLSIYRHHFAEIDVFGQVATMQPESHRTHRRTAASPSGAQEKTRTSTSNRPLEPESSASTNSATWASRDSRNKPRAHRCQSATLFAMTMVKKLPKSHCK